MTTKYTLSETTLRSNVNQSLQEWGVRLYSTDRRQNDFREKAIRDCIDSFNLQSKRKDDINDSIESLRDSNILPKGRALAIQHVLSSEMDIADGFVYYTAKDMLPVEYTSAPNYKYVSRYDREVEYRRKKDYQQFSLGKINPFDRFVKVAYSAEGWFKHIWKDGPDGLAGYVFEALVSHHMVFKMKCASCNVKGCLRWNGGFHEMGSWADVICTKCLASYEIKSKRNDEKVDQAFHYNSIPGGSFRTFYSHPFATTRYLIIVSRDAKFNTKLGRNAHRVSLANIKKVVPRLCPESFIDIGKLMRFKSAVSVDVISRKLEWCFVPEFNPDEESAGRSAIDLAEEAFDDRFGRGRWNSGESGMIEPSDVDDVSAINVDLDRLSIW